MEYWFTSDTHFNHAGIIKYCNRPFDTVEDMNEAIISRWNECVKPGDFVYHLGDFGWNKCDEIVKRLAGQKFLIIGSHDAEGERLKKHFCQLTPMKQIKIGVQTIVMTHCAMRVWEKSHYGAWHLYGHSHGHLETWGKSFDVGVDTHNFYPYSFMEVGLIMATLEDNFNDRRYPRPVVRPTPALA
jgi:calcineurin-like phosphoesterase family protein